MTDEFAGFPELTDNENEEIREARREGFAEFWPVYPNGEAQANNTLRGARRFLRGIAAESHNYGKEK